MARIQCKCGEALSNTQSPSDFIMHAYHDKNWDGLVDAMQKNPDNLPEDDWEIWRCKKCGRLIIFKNGSNHATYYKPEDS